MKNWQHVEKNEFHGHYIEDADTGRTVCDLYLKNNQYSGLNNASREPYFFEHDDAEEHAKMIEAAPHLLHLVETMYLFMFAGQTSSSNKAAILKEAEDLLKPLLKQENCFGGDGPSHEHKICLNDNPNCKCR